MVWPIADDIVLEASPSRRALRMVDEPRSRCGMGPHSVRRGHQARRLRSACLTETWKGIRAAARIGFQVAFQFSIGARSERWTRSRNAKQASIVARLTKGFSGPPFLRDQSMKTLCEPPSNTMRTFRIVGMALKTSMRSWTGEKRPGMRIVSSVVVTWRVRTSTEASGAARSVSP